MKKVLKKVLRSIFYIVVMSVLAFLPDFWLWHIGVSEWPLLLAILWWVPSLLLVLAEVGLQMADIFRSQYLHVKAIECYERYSY